MSVLILLTFALKSIIRINDADVSHEVGKNLSNVYIFFTKPPVSLCRLMYLCVSEQSSTKLNLIMLFRHKIILSCSCPNNNVLGIVLSLKISLSLPLACNFHHRPFFSLTCNLSTHTPKNN